jgi:cell division ATPase FtsA
MDGAEVSRVRSGENTTDVSESQALADLVGILYLLSGMVSAGSAELTGFVDLAQQVLQLPGRVGTPHSLRD